MVMTRAMVKTMEHERNVITPAITRSMKKALIEKEKTNHELEAMEKKMEKELQNEKRKGSTRYMKIVEAAVEKKIQEKTTGVTTRSMAKKFIEEEILKKHEELLPIRGVVKTKKTVTFCIENEAVSCKKTRHVIPGIVLAVFLCSYLFVF